MLQPQLADATSLAAGTVAQRRGMAPPKDVLQ
jgi:hypothetical protein